MTGSKALLVDEKEAVVATASLQYTLQTLEAVVLRKSFKVFDWRRLCHRRVFPQDQRGWFCHGFQPGSQAGSLIQS
jgi:hypothetical protein